MAGKIIKDGEVTDARIGYPKDFVEQLLHYGKDYSFLPLMN